MEEGFPVAGRLELLARDFAAVMLGGVRREYPNDLRHPMSGPDDRPLPHELHSAFYGCYDWHSAVEMHWALLRLLRSTAEHVPAGRDPLPLRPASRRRADRDRGHLLIERATEMVIGDIRFRGPPDADRTVEIGYSVIPDRRRRGYATESARALVGWAAEQPGVDSLIAGCDRDNVASIKTLERLGFGRTGETNRELRFRR